MQLTFSLVRSTASIYLISIRYRYDSIFHVFHIAFLHIKQSVCQIYNMLKYITITLNQYLFRNFEFCFFLFVFNKAASIPTCFNITLRNYKNYESGNQNSENTISRILYSYFLYQLVVLDYQLKNVSKKICFASQTKSTVLLIGYGIRKEDFMHSHHGLLKYPGD